jgi:hypothetical protein
VDILLPYRTDPRLLFQVIEYAKGKGIDRTALEARLGGGEPLRETLNALEQLGLIDREAGGEIRLTEAGRRLAYATGEDERRNELARAILRYPPYGVVLERALAEGASLIDAPWVERVWQVDMRLGQPRNRVEEARTFFFRLADEAALGMFRRGVRGQPSRLVLAPDLATRWRELSAEKAPQSGIQPVEEGTASSAVSSLGERWVRSGEPGLSLTVTVDMSLWELEKIEAFLRLIGLVGGDRRDG